MSFEMYDCNGNAVKHRFASVNGIRMHYVTAGEGPVLLLLHWNTEDKCLLVSDPSDYHEEFYRCGTGSSRIWLHRQAGSISWL